MPSKLFYNTSSILCKEWFPYRVLFYLSRVRYNGLWNLFVVKTSQSINTDGSR